MESTMRYFLYERNNTVLTVDSAVIPKVNGEDGVELSYDSYIAAVARINADMLKLHADAVENLEKINLDRLTRKQSILYKLGVSDADMELFI
jgi:hypothetical protein